MQKRKRFFLPKQRELFKEITEELLPSAELKQEHIRTFLMKVKIEFRNRYTGKVLKCFTIKCYDDLMYEFIRILEELEVNLMFDSEILFNVDKESDINKTVIPISRVRSICAGVKDRDLAMVSSNPDP